MKRIHFILAANAPGAMARVTTEFANRLVKRGFEVIVSVPLFNYFDFALWQIDWNRKASRGRIALFKDWLSWLVIPMIRAVLFKKRWYGQTIHSLDRRVRVNRFWFLPMARGMPDADWIVVFQCYLIPHLLYLPASKGKIVGGARLDYLPAVKEPNEVVARWRLLCNSIEKRLKIPIFACSERSRESLRVLEISQDAPIVYNGINVEEFTDGRRRGEVSPVRITMFCHDHPQKGQDFGCAVIRRLKQHPLSKKVIFCSVGPKVMEKHKDLFDLDYGYLTGKDYVRVYQETDIFLFPSLYEGFPAPPLEAMACGCAVATTLVSGVEEYGVHGKNCMICSPGDVQKMTQNIQALIEGVGLRDSLRENALATVRRYSWEESTDSLIDFLTQEAERSVSLEPQLEKV